MNEILNKQEREVLRKRLADEKKILTQLEAYYEDALQEIDNHIALLLGRQDANLPNVINHIEYQRMIKGQVQASLDKLQAKEYESIEAYLEESYTDAFVGSMYSLHAQNVPVIVPIDQAVARPFLRYATEYSQCHKDAAITGQADCQNGSRAGTGTGHNGCRKKGRAKGR